jgi:hypothetical protein
MLGTDYSGFVYPGVQGFELRCALGGVLGTTGGMGMINTSNPEPLVHELPPGMLCRFLSYICQHMINPTKNTVYYLEIHGYISDGLTLAWEMRFERHK